MLARIASFQLKAKTMMAVATSPLTARGRLMRVNTPRSFAPSRNAASSSSRGMSRKTSRMITTPNGRVAAT